MPEEQMSIRDNIEVSLESDTGVPQKKDYRVTHEGGIMKRGKIFNNGEKISLDEKTANGFLINGHIEEI